MFYDYDGSGKERELCISVHTLVVYEQQFKSGMIEDVIGKVRLSGDNVVDEDGTVVIADYTIDNWTAYARALWAMLKAGADLARAEGRPYEKIPGFEEWSVLATNLDMAEVSRVVVRGMQEELFRSGAASAKEDAEELG